MRLPDGPAGFGSRAALMVSWLRSTVAASLAAGVLLLGAIVMLLALSVRLGAGALPL